MRLSRFKIGMALIVACLQTANACTTFSLNYNQHAVFGRNYDWWIGVGMAMVNKRGLQKSMIVMGDEQPARWTARYGSLTFNQYGRELPSGGMNEKGLVVEVMWLNDTEYPDPDKRPAANGLSWIQYQLDTATTVSEVIASDANIRITPQFGTGLHYLVCERSGVCATIEFINGALIAHTGSDLPLPVLTNDTYSDSLDYSTNAERQRRNQPDAAQSLHRFALAAKMLKTYGGNDPGKEVDYAFDILQKVAMPSMTQWSIVYDQTAQQVYFRTRVNKQMRSINMAALDFSCKTLMKILDMNAAGAADVTANLSNYTSQANRDLIEQAFRNTEFTSDIPAKALDRLASKPDSFSCS